MCLGFKPGAVGLNPPSHAGPQLSSIKCGHSDHPLPQVGNKKSPKQLFDNQLLFALKLACSEKVLQK